MTRQDYIQRRQFRGEQRRMKSKHARKWESQDRMLSRSQKRDAENAEVLRDYPGETYRGTFGELRCWRCGRVWPTLTNAEAFQAVELCHGCDDADDRREP